MTGALLLALTAGMLGAVNPCGFAMLPAYLSVLVAGPGDGRGAVGRALTATAGLTLGYAAVFGAFGLAVAPAADWLRPRLPWLTVTLGVLLALAGLWLLAGRRLPTPRPWRTAPRLIRTWPSMALFGAAYALTSLTCAIAPFLAIVVTSLRAGSPLRGLALFGAYALGMALVVGVAALAVALLRGRVVAGLRGAGAWVSRLSGLVLLVAGGYVAWYGWYEVRLALGRHDAFGDPVVTAAARLQQTLVSTLNTAGPAPLAALSLTLLALGLLVRRGPLLTPPVEAGAPLDSEAPASSASGVAPASGVAAASSDAAAREAVSGSG